MDTLRITVFAVSILAAASCQAGDYRVNCEANSPLLCNPLSAQKSMQIAFDLSQEKGLAVNDSIVIYSSKYNGSHFVEKFREISVVSSPVASLADLHDWGSTIDVTDYAPPPPGLAALDGPGIGDWYEGNVIRGPVGYWFRN